MASSSTRAEALRAYLRVRPRIDKPQAHVIQELVGHQDLKTTARYLHMRKRQAHAAIQKLEQRHAAENRDKRRDSQQHMDST